MKIMVNGKEEDHNQDKLLANLIEERNLNKERIVVELNLEIIPPKGWANKKIKEGDSIEIVSFIGGG